MTRSEYTIALSAALRTQNLTHQLYDVLTAIAVIQSRTGEPTNKAAVALTLDCTYHNIVKHIERNPDFFTITDSKRGLNWLALTQAGIDILAKVQEAVERRQLIETA